MGIKKEVSAFIGVLVLFAAGCEAESTTTTASVCMTPAATYKIEFKAENGNCPTELVKAIVEGNATTSAKASEVCFTKSMSNSANYTDDATGATCAIAYSGSAFGTNGGYGGTMSVAATCSDNSSCQHSFKVIYTKQ